MSQIPYILADVLIHPTYSPTRNNPASTPSILQGNLHLHTVVMTTKKHVLLSDNHPLVLRYIFQLLDALSWLQTAAPSTHSRTSPLASHMVTVAKIYSALQDMTFVPPWGHIQPQLKVRQDFQIGQCTVAPPPPGLPHLSFRTHNFSCNPLPSPTVSSSVLDLIYL